MLGMYFFIFASFEPWKLYLSSTSVLLMAHNWQKWKSTFLTCPCHKIYRVEAVGPKKFQLYFKNYHYCENVKFGAILWKFDILSITASLKLGSKIPFAHLCDTYNYDYLPHTTIRFYSIDFQFNADFPSQLYVFYRKIT